MGKDSNQFEIRVFEEGDLNAIAKAFGVVGQNKPLELFQRYWDENVSGIRKTFIVLVAGEIVAYSNVKFGSEYEPFKMAGIPEINDMNTLDSFRKRGIATALVGACEEYALSRGIEEMGIGVGNVIKLGFDWLRI